MHYIDQIGRLVALERIPKRIASVVPSQTEYLYDLGLGDQIVGITKFCVRPSHLLRQISHIGGTKKLHIDSIKALRPDLVIANLEENTREDIEAIMAFCPVWISNIKTLDDALEMMLELGKITGQEERSKAITIEIGQKKERLDLLIKGLETKPRVVYLIWREPYMTVGKDTFIHSMLQMSGFDNIFGDLLRYPVISIEEIATSKPDFVFFSSEPYPFKKKHLDDIQLFCPQSRLTQVDGEAFSWYGSRLIASFDYLCQVVMNCSI